MLNRIIIINSELYAKGSIHIGENTSIQITAENNVGKSSFLNTLNFLYITDKDQMRFEDDRRLADSMKHYFDGTSLHSFIVFEISKNGYYCILVKATPENTIEYYKINGEYREHFFIQTSTEGFKPKKWENILRELTLDDPTDPPVLLKGEDLYNLVYNSDKNKSPVVWIKREVKRKGKALSNSFTDIYRHLIKTSEINDKSFRNALLIANNQQDVTLNVFASSSYDKINEFEKKKMHLANLSAVKSEFEKLLLLNDKFISEEVVLGKLKNTFLKRFGDKERELSEKIDEGSDLSRSIRSLETKIEVPYKNERDDLVANKRTIQDRIQEVRQANVAIEKQLKEVEEYEPEESDLLFQGLLTKADTEEEQKRSLESQLMQLEQSRFTSLEIEKAINNLKSEISSSKATIEQFHDLLYQNISPNPETVKKAYSFLNPDIAKLDKTKIKKKISKADFDLTFFDGIIDVSDVPVKELPTISELQEGLEVKKKDLAIKESQLDVALNRDNLRKKAETLKKSIVTVSALIDKIRHKPTLRQQKAANEVLINITLKDLLTKNEMKISEKEAEIRKAKTALDLKTKEKKQHIDNLKAYKTQYQNIRLGNDIYEIEEVLDEPFETLYDTFEKIHKTFAGPSGTRERRRDLKDAINHRLKKDTQDIKSFIREVGEEIDNIPQVDKAISHLLDTLSYEIGSPTFTFLSLYNDFKTFVYKSYNSRLAEYPVSNIKNVKVKLCGSDELIGDLNKISNLNFRDSLDFDNSYAESKKALERQLNYSRGKPIALADLFTVKVEITKANGEVEEIDLAKQVQSRGTNIVLKLYLFLNILKNLVQPSDDNRIVVYVDELDAIGQKNIRHLIRFCKEHYFVPIFAAPRKVEGIQKYYVVKEPVSKNNKQKSKITFGEMQSFPVDYRNAKQDV